MEVWLTKSSWLAIEVRPLLLPKVDWWLRGLRSDELVAFSVAHGRAVFDALHVLLVEERDHGRIQVQEVPDLVAHVGSNLHISTVVQPNLKESFSGTKADASSNNEGLLKLLTCSEFRLIFCLPMSAKSILSHILSAFWSR